MKVATASLVTVNVPPEYIIETLQSQATYFTLRESSKVVGGVAIVRMKYADVDQVPAAPRPLDINVPFLPKRSKRNGKKEEKRVRNEDKAPSPPVTSSTWV